MTFLPVPDGVECVRNIMPRSNEDCVPALTVAATSVSTSKEVGLEGAEKRNGSSWRERVFGLNAGNPRT
jgi:hypothetical protein